MPCVYIRISLYLRDVCTHTRDELRSDYATERRLPRARTNYLIRRRLVNNFVKVRVVVVVVVAVHIHRALAVTWAYARRSRRRRR